MGAQVQGRGIHLEFPLPCQRGALEHGVALAVIESYSELVVPSHRIGVSPRDTEVASGPRDGARRRIAAIAPIDERRELPRGLRQVAAREAAHGTRVHGTLLHREGLERECELGARIRNGRATECGGIHCRIRGRRSRAACWTQVDTEHAARGIGAEQRRLAIRTEQLQRERTSKVTARGLAKRGTAELDVEIQTRAEGHGPE